MVRMITDRDKKIAVNPRHVVMLEKSGEWTIIYLSNKKTVYVIGDISEVETKLAEGMRKD